MEETKHPLASKTIWTSILQIVASILVATGVFSADQGGLLTSIGPELIVGGIGAGLAIVSGCFRLTAKTQLKAKTKGDLTSA